MLAAALTFTQRLIPLRVTHINRIVADTAWVAIYDPRTDMVGGVPTDSTAGSSGVRTREVRVERRDGRWQRVERR